ncbi:MAG: hypothetical protein E3J35_00045 [Methanomassiliicoccales archaeon]|nr:MAG: hypothetical protein E3J35_00045 [Methanomassiliicoccales archaeon]
MEAKPIDVRKAIECPSEPETKPPTKRHRVIQSGDWPAYTKYFGAREPKTIAYMTTELVKKLASGEWAVVEAEAKEE